MSEPASVAENELHRVASAIQLARGQQFGNFAAKMKNLRREEIINETEVQQVVKHASKLHKLACRQMLGVPERDPENKRWSKTWVGVATLTLVLSTCQGEFVDNLEKAAGEKCSQFPQVARRLFNEAYSTGPVVPGGRPVVLRKESGDSRRILSTFQPYG